MKRYFCILRSNNPEIRIELRNKIIDAGYSVPFEYEWALEFNIPEEFADTLLVVEDIILFSSKIFKKSSLEKLNKKQLSLAKNWNKRLSKQSSYNDSPAKDAQECRSDLNLDPEKYEEVLIKKIKEQEVKKGPAKPVIKLNDVSKWTSKEHLEVINYLRKHIKDETISSRIKNLSQNLSKDLLRYFLTPDWLDVFVDVFIDHSEENGCWKMRGKQALSIIFVESSQTSGPKFTWNERDRVTTNIRIALEYLVGEYPGNDLTWAIQEQFVSINVDNGTDGETLRLSDDEYFLKPAIGQLQVFNNNYDPSFSGLASFREDLRQAFNAEHAFAIFVTPYGTSWHAYRSSRHDFILLSKHPGRNGNDWGGYGIDRHSKTVLHEIIHQYNGLHEYGITDHGKQPCTTCHGEFGCDKIPNGNCVDCTSVAHDCTMRDSSFNLCPWTRAHIGWSDLFIEITTSGENGSGTDDPVTLDIGNQSFVLDVRNHNDRESGQKDGYSVWAGGELKREDIHRIIIRKERHHWLGEWKLDRVKVWHKGDVICNEVANSWLDENKSHFLACSFTSTFVNSIRLFVTTADELFAGTDDDVSLTIANRTWLLDNRSTDDFEAGSTNIFDLDPGLGLRVEDLRTIRIHKSSDGFAGGWKLAGLRLSVNGVEVYDNNSINEWLEGNSRSFSDQLNMS